MVLTILAYNSWEPPFDLENIEQDERVYTVELNGIRYIPMPRGEWFARSSTGTYFVCDNPLSPLIRQGRSCKPEMKPQGTDAPPRRVD
jgi:hypothetical protein